MAKYSTLLLFDQLLAGSTALWRTSTLAWAKDMVNTDPKASSRIELLEEASEDLLATISKLLRHFERSSESDIQNLTLSQISPIIDTAQTFAMRASLLQIVASRPDTLLGLREAADAALADCRELSRLLTTKSVSYTDATVRAIVFAISIGDGISLNEAQQRFDRRWKDP